MRQLCLRTQRRKAGGAALDNAQIGTARTLGGRGLQALDLFLEDLIDALVTTIFHNAGGNSLGPLDALARDAGGILGEHGAVATNVSGGSGLRSRRKHRSGNGSRLDDLVQNCGSGGPHALVARIIGHGDIFLERGIGETIGIHAILGIDRSSDGGRLVQIQLLLLYHRFSHSAGNDRAAYHILPAGAFYALFNRVSLFQMKVDKNKCVSCGKCAKACKMDVDVTKTPNHTECIRCGMCIRACPTNAVSFRYGFGDGKKEPVEPVDTLKTEETK